MAARSKAYVCGRWIDGIAGSNPAEGIDIGLLCVVGSGLCDVLISLSEETYGVCVCVCVCVCLSVCVCVSVCDLETSTVRRPRL